MSKTNFLKGVLSSNSDKKNISCDVQIRFEKLEDIAESSPSFVYSSSDYIDGYRIDGELSFIDNTNSKDLSFADCYNLTVWYESDPKTTTLFRVFLYSRGHSSGAKGVNLIKKFFRFVATGVPTSDSIGLFPEEYTGTNSDKMYFCTCLHQNLLEDFSAVIVCKNKFEAKSILQNKLNQLSFGHIDMSWFCFKLLNLQETKIHVFKNKLDWS